MKKVSATIKSLITTGQPIKYFVLVKIFSTPILTFSSLPFSVSFDGDSYASNSRLIGYDAMRHSNLLDRGEYKISVSDYDKAVENTLISSGFSAIMQVRAGVFDAAGVPDLSLNGMVLVYKGLIDTWSPTMQDNKRELVIQGTSPMGPLDWTNPSYTSPATVKRWNSNDTSMDFIGSIREEELTIKWGKKE